MNCPTTNRTAITEQDGYYKRVGLELGDLAHVSTLMINLTCIGVCVNIFANNSRRGER